MFAKLHPIKLGFAAMTLSALYEITNLVIALIYGALYGMPSFSFMGIVMGGAMLLVSIAISFIPAFILATAYNYFLDKQ